MGKKLSYIIRKYKKILGGNGIFNIFLGIVLFCAATIINQYPPIDALFYAIIFSSGIFFGVLLVLYLYISYTITKMPSNLLITKCTKTITLKSADGNGDLHEVIEFQCFRDDPPEVISKKFNYWSNEDLKIESVDVNHDEKKDAVLASIQYKMILDSDTKIIPKECERLTKFKIPITIRKDKKDNYIDMKVNFKKDYENAFKDTEEKAVSGLNITHQTKLFELKIINKVDDYFFIDENNYEVNIKDSYGTRNGDAEKKFNNVKRDKYNKELTWIIDKPKRNYNYILRFNCSKKKVR